MSEDGEIRLKFEALVLARVVGGIPIDLLQPSENRLSAIGEWPGDVG
jgi:hypothetical protein